MVHQRTTALDASATTPSLPGAHDLGASPASNTSATSPSARSADDLAAFSRVSGAADERSAIEAAAAHLADALGAYVAVFADGTEVHAAFASCLQEESTDALRVVDIRPHRRSPLHPSVRSVHGLPILGVCEIDQHHQFLLARPDTDVAPYEEELVDAMSRVLAAAIRSLRSAQQVQEQKALLLRLSEEAAHGAFHDYLTGLATRPLFVETIDRATLTLHTNPLGGRFSVLLLDLHRFKHINDTLGHRAGDEVLRTVAERMVSIVRTSDVVARIGGDQFAVILRDTANVAEIDRIAQRLVDEISAPIRVEEALAFVDVRVGATIADQTLTTSEILQSADAALYRAKQSGRVRAFVCEPVTRAQQRSNVDLETNLRNAIDADEFFLEYQPISRMTDRRTVGVEALVRWRHGTQVVPPSVFIELAEQTGLIVPIGLHVLRIACQQMQTWNRERVSSAEFSVHVNVSARQLEQPAFAQNVADILEATGVDPNQLCLEITESVLLSTDLTIEANLDMLRLAGVRLYIDDFGTGYASLSYLKRFSFDGVKIDKSFIDDIAADDPAGVLARTIAGIGRSLGMEVIAEGIENEPQVDALRSLGCDAAQGFLFSRPLAATEVSAQIRGELRRPALYVVA